MTLNHSGCFKVIYCFLRSWYLYFLAIRNWVYMLLKQLHFYTGYFRISFILKLLAKLFKIHKYRHKQTEKCYQKRRCVLSRAVIRSSTRKTLLIQEYIKQYMCWKTLRKQNNMGHLRGRAGRHLHCHQSSSYSTCTAHESKATVTAIRILIPNDYSVF
jgi:hypothetical protein